jgi:hypothetical protein
MSVRRSILGLVAAAAIGFAACSGTTASGVPSVAIPSDLPTVPASISAEGLEGFCADFVNELQTDWPNIDATTASALASVVSSWSTSPELSTISGDVQVIGAWLSAAATATAVPSPTAEVQTAFTNIEAFAEANC